MRTMFLTGAAAIVAAGAGLTGAAATAQSSEDARPAGPSIYEQCPTLVARQGDGPGLDAVGGGRGRASAYMGHPPPPPPPPAGQVNVTGSPAAEAGALGRPLPPGQWPVETVDRERYPDADPNPVRLTAEEPVSTFSVDVDTAAYALVRRSLNENALPPTDAVRIEEMVNYFDYNYALPDNRDAPFAASVTVTPNPWNAATQLLHVGIQGYDIPADQTPNSNLVFLIDVSGSMLPRDRLPLALDALRMLLPGLDADDTVSIVVYAGAAGAILEPTRGSDRHCIEAALDMLTAGGSTAGGAGMRLAYDFARRNFDPAAVNRVLLLTDGDFNVGITSDERLEDFVARQRDSGIYLSVFGFGRGNYNDRMMQAVAQSGNGIAAYIDSAREARRVMVEAANSMLFPIANDVKIQIEFNPARVAEYRLVGYETRMLAREDFNNDQVDAGEIGSGHTVTAIYEITAPDSAGRLVDPLRYGASAPAATGEGGEYAFLRIRYKPPGEDESRLIERPVTSADEAASLDAAGADVRFAIHVAGFAQLLRGDPYIAESGYGYAAIADAARGALGEDSYGYRAEFVTMVETAARIAAREDPKPGG